ncbi:hypothetical protein VIGAN_08063000, partial [Vigna angularis var. angularis]
HTPNPDPQTSTSDFTFPNTHAPASWLGSNWRRETAPEPGRRGCKPSTASHRDLRFLRALCSKKRPVRWVKLLTKKGI